MEQCKCGSYAVNIDPEYKVCDVCFYKNRLVQAEEKFYKIQSWCEAFPFSDFEKANKVLKNIQEIIDAKE